MGPGWIAERFTESVQADTSQVIAAIGSRSLDRSEAFAGRHGVPAAFGSYEELAASDIDIIYVATPHNFHYEAALMALDAGKHVLVEKPIGINREQAAGIASRAAGAGLFAAEAMLTFFLPKFDVIREVLDSAMLGDLTTVFAEYGEYFDRSHRIFDPALAGGPLLDLGTYPLSLITSAPGEPDRLRALGEPHETGVNAQLSAVMSFAGRREAMMNTQLHNFTPTSATIVGTEASLTIDGPFNIPRGFTIGFPDGTRLAYEEPVGTQVDGLHYEAAAVAPAIAAGQLEVPQRPLAESIRTIAESLPGAQRSPPWLSTASLGSVEKSTNSAVRNLHGNSVRTITAKGRATFGAGCTDCPLRSRCTTASPGRSVELHREHALMREHRAAARDERFQADYTRHRPMVERSIAWLVKDNRRLRYRGTAKTTRGGSCA